MLARSTAASKWSSIGASSFTRLPSGATSAAGSGPSGSAAGGLGLAATAGAAAATALGGLRAGHAATATPIAANARAGSHHRTRTRAQDTLGAMRTVVLAIAIALSACDRDQPLPAPVPVASAAPLPPLPAPASAPAVVLPPAPAEPKPPPEKPTPEPGGRSPSGLAAGMRSLPGAAFAGPIERESDAAWLERLATQPIVDVVRNKGGATITLRVRFADGKRAAFKPEQRHSASNYRAEIAAFHLDRVLGFGRTAPVLGRSVDAGRLRQWLEHAETDPKWLERFDESVLVRDGRVRGALIAWHEKRLTSAAPPPRWTAALLDADAGALPEERALEWSDLVLFDYLIDNTDRWSGGNVLALGDGGPLIFLDNAAGFMRKVGAEPEKSPVAKVCRFRKQTVATLRAASDGKLGELLGASLAGDPLGSALTPGQLREVDRRVGLLLEHVDRCIATHGEERALSL